MSEPARVGPGTRAGGRSAWGALSGRARPGPVRASAVAARCLLRGLPLFLRAPPGTPLRVLGIIAFDTLHLLRTGQPLPRRRIRELAMFLDFQGFANAEWDLKNVCRTEYQRIRQQLETAGLSSCVEAYLGRLGLLEGRRPSIGGDHRRFDEVRSYREAVARLSIATTAAIALHDGSLDEGIRAAERDDDVETLSRILMLCQVIDDVLDYAEDLSAGLPSYLTACASLSHSMASTRAAARSYGARHGGTADDVVLPLRLSLWVITAVTTLVIRAASWRYRPLTTGSR